MGKITRARYEAFSESEKKSFIEYWNDLSNVQQESVRDNSELNASLLPFRGCRVEATDEKGVVSRFWVGQSTGWIPCTLTIHTKRSIGGSPAYGNYSNIKVIRYPQ